MIITVSVPDQLNEIARLRGLSVQQFVEQLAVEALAGSMDHAESDRQNAVEALLEFRQENNLTLQRDPSVRLRDWIHQDHKY